VSIELAAGTARELEGSVLLHHQRRRQLELGQA